MTSIAASLSLIVYAALVSLFNSESASPNFVFS